MLEIKSFLTPYMQSFCYIISDNGKALVIDPCKMEEIMEYFVQKEIRLEYCILTHEHYDHISGLDWMHEMNVPVIASYDCDLALKDTRKNQSRYFETFSMLQSRLKNFPIPQVEEYVGYADKVFKEEDRMDWNGHVVYLRQTPGHSEGGICVLIDDLYLFPGDTIFLEYDTNTKVPGGSKKELNTVSLPWIAGLRDDIRVYPGHYKDFTMKEWKENHDTI